MQIDSRIRESLHRRRAAVVLDPIEVRVAWDRIGERLDAGPSGRKPQRSRALAAVLAFAVAAAGIGFAAWAFRDHRPPTSTVGPKPDGPIGFVRSVPGSLPGVDNTDLFLVEPDGSGLRNLTHSQDAESAAVWSPGGSKVLFVRQTSTGSGGSVKLTAGIFTMNADGTGLREILPCTDECRSHDFVWSPDGTRIAFIADDSRVAQAGQGIEPGTALEVMNADGSGVRKLCGLDECAQGVGAPAWSPDGSRLAFSQQGVFGFPGIGILPSAIWVVNPDGSGLKKLTDLQCHPGHNPVGPCPDFDSGPTWSPNGSVIAFSRLPTGIHGGNEAAVETIRPDGTGLRTLYRCSRGAPCSQELAPRWSPDGSTIAVATSAGESPEIELVAVDGSGVRTIRTCAGTRCVIPYEVIWSPDGRSLLFFEGNRTSSIYTIGLDASDLRLVATNSDGNSLQWLPGPGTLSSSIPTGVVSPSGPTGSSIPQAPLTPGLIAFSWGKGGHDIYTIRSDGSGLVRLTSGHYEKSEPAWSPDGRRIAFAADPPGAPNTGIYVMSSDGSGLRVVTSGAGGSVEPTWSPDGTRLAFACTGRGIDSALCIVNTDGTGLHTINAGPGGNFEPTWSPDGRTILLDSQPKGSSGDSLYLLDPSTGTTTRLTHLPGEIVGFAWSPDGSTIAFVWDTTGGSGLYLIDAAGSNLRRVGSVPDPSSPTWSPDGSRIAFVAGPRSGLPNGIYSVLQDGTGLARVFTGSSDISGLSWQPVR